MTSRIKYHLMFVDARPRKSDSGLCQNCVIYPPKPRANIVSYEDTPTRIDVAGDFVELPITLAGMRRSHPISKIYNSAKSRPADSGGRT